MRFLLFLTTLIATASVQAAAGAPFRDAPPASVRLLEVPAPGAALAQLPLRLLAQAAPEEEAPLPPPPLVPAPGGEAPKTRPSPDEVDPITGLRPDPYAGTFVGKEVAVGALMVLAVDIAAAATFFGVVLAVIAANPRSDVALGAIVLGLLIAGAVDFFFAPLGAALGVYWMAPKDTSHNGLFGAILGAYTAQLGLTALFVGISLALAAGSSATGGNGAAFQGLNSLASLLFLALHYAMLPMAASFGLHWGGPVARADETRRQPAGLPVTPDALYALQRPTGAPPVFSIAF